MNVRYRVELTDGERARLSFCPVVLILPPWYGRGGAARAESGLGGAGQAGLAGEVSDAA